MDFQQADFFEPILAAYVLAGSAHCWPPSKLAAAGLAARRCCNISKERGSDSRLARSILQTIASRHDTQLEMWSILCIMH